MKKVYRIYFVKLAPVKRGFDGLFAYILDRYGVREYESYEEAEEIVVDNELEGATILPLYLSTKSTSTPFV